MVQGAQSHNDVAASNVVAGDIVPVPNCGGGQLFNLTAFNPHATDLAYLHLYDARAAGVTVGTTVPKRTFPLPPQGGVDTARVAAIEFFTGLSYAVTAGASGAVAPSSACIIGFEFKRAK